MTDYMPNAYYDAISKTFDDVYHRDDADLQEDLAMVGDVIEQNVVGARVLDLGSGTGFWSRVASRWAESVVGLERSEEMIRVARSAEIPSNLAFTLGDVWEMMHVDGGFQALIAVMWFSHVPKSRTQEFLELVAKRVGPGG
ncbi:MAG: class I SAM-dependent methyltransferase, partial [Planctomycetes bacterium]|nr:class I SAM-dependent methyltransferase [Planctomycetota bacterium]